MRQPDVAVIIPAFNEAPDIAGCLEAVAAQDLGGRRLEVLVADGDSEDATRSVIAREAARLALEVRIVDNPGRRTSIGLNRALDVVRAPLTVRVDARARLEPGYIATVAEVLATRPDVGVVGGAQVANPRRDCAREKGIARALRNRWGTGFARYRWSTRSGATDTVWMGAFRTGQLRRLGGWAEEVELNEDYELNERYRRSGLLVWYEASLRTNYLPRSTIVQVARQYFRYGRVKGTWWGRGVLPSPRQRVVLLLPPIAIAGGAVIGRRSWSLAGGLAVGTVAAIEVFGDDEPSSLATHLFSALTLTTIWVAWSAGVVAGLRAAQPRPSRNLR